MRAVLRIKALREQVGLTTTQLADRLNVERTTVYKWESGENRPTADGLLRLAEFFHCTIDELYDRDASRRGSA